MKEEKTMSKLKKIVLFAGLGAILLAVITITSVSLIKYAIYRSQFKDVEAEVRTEYVIAE